MNEDILIPQSLRKCLKEYVIIWETFILNSGNQTIYPMTILYL